MYSAVVTVSAPTLMTTAAAFATVSTTARITHKANQTETSAMPEAVSRNSERGIKTGHSVGEYKQDMTFSKKIQTGLFVSHQLRLNRMEWLQIIFPSSFMSLRLY
jgi:hypothetical protein